MGIFYESAPVAPLVEKALADALATDPKSVADRGAFAQQKAADIQKEASPRFAWKRLGVAIVLLVFILACAIYTGNRQPTLKELYTVLLHAFELLLGAVVGLLTGEAVSHR